MSEGADRSRFGEALDGQRREGAAHGEPDVEAGSYGILLHVEALVGETVAVRADQHFMERRQVGGGEHAVVGQADQ